MSKYSAHCQNTHYCPLSKYNWQSTSSCWYSLGDSLVNCPVCILQPPHLCFPNSIVGKYLYIHLHPYFCFCLCSYFLYSLEPCLTPLLPCLPIVGKSSFTGDRARQWIGLSGSPTKAAFPGWTCQLEAALTFVQQPAVCC